MAIEGYVIIKSAICIFKYGQQTHKLTSRANSYQFGAQLDLCFWYIYEKHNVGADSICRLVCVCID